ncbi:MULTISPECIES: TetR/AcrR family transcriptional regulator [Actinomadura]|uniref:TetR/AcrR family transcriptional regulator n=1 Tax=Actinomadura yumaensis TaxID=111807 RepID=A0ABW2CUR2_9ACTN|nr:TetR/AcrR family transcriptional regulator [Actinomadura sp. J1-007]
MTPRVRRDPEEARRLILEAAERLLATGGVAAVQVRAVAARVGVTDAAVNHHFGNRDRLLQALLRHGGVRLKQRLEKVGGDDVEQIVGSLAAVYADGYAELALALHRSGWRDSGSGMLAPVVDALCERARAEGRARPDRRRVQLAVAALHQGVALDPVVGAEFRRSAGLTDATSAETLAWWTQAMIRMLDS